MRKADGCSGRIIALYISPFQSSGSGLDDRKISRCHLPPPHGSMTSAATTSTRISANDAAFGIAFEVIGGLVPREARVQHHRQEQVVAVVDDDELAAGALERRVVDEVFLGAVGADVALQRELARDDLFDRDLLVPAVAAVALLAARLGDFLRAAQRAPRLGHGLSGHRSELLRGITSDSSLQPWPAQPLDASCAYLSRSRRRYEPASRRASAGPYMLSAYSLTIRRALKRGATEMIACRTIASQRRGMPRASRS